jgi:SNF2-related domain/Helicase conserved C-terminal domain
MKAAGEPVAFLFPGGLIRGWQRGIDDPQAQAPSSSGGGGFSRQRPADLPMPHDFSNLIGQPGLREWILSGKWKGAFDPKTLIRGHAYANGRMIRQLTAGVCSNGRGVVVSATVHGTAPRPYQTEVRLGAMKGHWGIDPDCSCPVSYLCKHTAGLLSYLSAELAGGHEAGAPQLTPELREWLATIETAARAGAPAAVAADTKPENRFLAYCIESKRVHEGSRMNFVLRVGTRQKDGSIRISDSRANADPSRPPKYMTRQDLTVAAIYYQRHRKLRLWDDMPFEGSGWEEILAGALETGNVFLRQQFRDHRPVTSGPALFVRATWKTLPSGGARPVLECDNPDFILLPTQPPRYLDPATGGLGLLESDLPPAILSAWQSGPAVSSRDLPIISARFSAISSTSLPTPAEVKTESRQTAAPEPRLRIYPRTLGGKWDSQMLTVGELSFRYADSPWIPPLASGDPPSHAELREGRRVVWPRAFNAEQAHWQNLRRSGLLPLTGLLSVQHLDAAALRSFVPEKPFPTQQLAWLGLLESPRMAQLRAAGWTIEIDPAAGLTSKDAGGFFPAIEADPDHGIDWFQFDVSYEVDGKQVSLIPIIAEAIRMDLPPVDAPDLPEFISLARENPGDGFIRFPARQLIELVGQVRHLFHGPVGAGPLRIDRLAAAGVADGLAIDSSSTTRALAKLGHSLKHITSLPAVEIPATVRAELRHYQQEGYRWLQFLAAHGLHGILADDMGLGKTVQTLAHLAAERAKNPRLPSLVIAPTSVVPNWAAEAAKFTPHLKVLTLQGKDRAAEYRQIPKADVVLTSYPLLARDFPELSRQSWHVIVLDEAQYIKNPKSISAQNACKLKAAHRLCLSGTPMENHLGELWSLMRFLMPGFLSDEKSFNIQVRRPIERDRLHDVQSALNRRVSPLILRRTKDQVATELPEKTELIHGIDLHKKQADLYESIRAAMDKRVRDAIAAKGLAKSHIIVLDALLKLRQTCCHPQLLKSAAAQKVAESAKLDYLTGELLPTLLEEGRRILLFSTFTSMLALIEEHLIAVKIPYLKLTGQTKDRASLVKEFQQGETPIFLISLKAGGTGLNLTAADTVIHYDPWWNPAAENQATDRAHRIGQTKPVFVHKLVCRGTIEDRILELQKHKAALVEALLSEETGKLKIDAETLSHLLSPVE